MGKYRRHIHLVADFKTSLKRSRVDPKSIKLPSRPGFETPEDGSIRPESDVDEANFQKKLEKADKAFVEHRTNGPSLERLGKSILQAMCEMRELGDYGTKSDLVDRLIHWVRIIARFIYTYYLTNPSSVIQTSQIRRKHVLNHETSSGETSCRRCGTI